MTPLVRIGSCNKHHTTRVKVTSGDINLNASHMSPSPSSQPRPPGIPPPGIPPALGRWVELLLRAENPPPADLGCAHDNRPHNVTLDRRAGSASSQMSQSPCPMAVRPVRPAVWLPPGNIITPNCRRSQVRTCRYSCSYAVIPINDANVTTSPVDNVIQGPPLRSTLEAF